MATRNFPVIADAFFDSSAPNDTHGADPALPVGKVTVSGFTFLCRSLAKFSLDWTGVSTITSAVLHIRTSSAGWVGSSPGQIIKRVTASWTEGSVTWNTQPATTATGQATVAMGAAFSTWYTADITAIVTAWAPTSIPGGGATTNNGVLLVGDGEVSTADGTTFASRESAYDAYIVLTYSSNSAPYAPRLDSPINYTIIASQNPSLTFAPQDPDGDTHLRYAYAIDDNPDFLSPIEGEAEIIGSFPNNVPIVRVGVNTLVRGTTYYWRVKTSDALLYGPYASAGVFKVGALPTATVTSPVASSTAELWYTAGSNTTPKIRARWSYSDANGAAQTHSRVYIYADSAGSPGANVYDSGWVGNTTAEFQTTYAAVNGTKYHVSVQVRSSLTLESVESAKKITRVRWGRASYYFDSGSVPVSLSVANTTVIAANEAMVVEYTTATGTTEPTTWYANVASAGLKRYFWHRVTMWGYGSAAPTSPDLTSVTWSYSAIGLTVDNWTVATGGVIDVNARVFGTQSLRHDCNGAEQRSYQLVTVMQNRTMVLSGRMKVSGNPAAKLRIMSSDGTVELAKIDAPTATAEFARFVTPSIDTGSDTSLRIECYSNAAASNVVWFDALKFEESTVATPWTPGFVTGAVTVDAGGLGIDASRGGVMRFRGSGGAPDDLVELGVHGLRFNGKEVSFGSAFPASPGNHDVCYRTDLDIMFFWNATASRWLSIHVLGSNFYSDAIFPVTATNTMRAPIPYSSSFEQYVDWLHASTYVQTTNTGANFWTLTLKHNPAGTTIGSFTTAADAADGWKRHSIGIAAVLATTVTEIELVATKTGTPGGLFMPATVGWRFVG